MEVREVKNQREIFLLHEVILRCFENYKAKGMNNLMSPMKPTGRKQRPTADNLINGKRKKKCNIFILSRCQKVF